MPQQSSTPTSTPLARVEAFYRRFGLRELVLDSDDARLIAGFRRSEPAQQRYRWTDSEATLRPARAPARAAA
jgi:hypothetical protein